MSKTVGDLVFKAVLWRYQGPAAWCFVTLTPKVAASIWQLLGGGPRRPGFGSIRVLATIGNTTWPTSLFPDKASRSYLLPVKVVVRKREGLTEGQSLIVHLRVVG